MKTRGKIIFALILIGIVYFIFGIKPVEAATMSTKYFGINEIRTLSGEDFGYAIGDPKGSGAKIWNILKYSSSISNDPTEVDVYCVKAGVGFSNTHRLASYNLSFDMYKDRTAIAAQNDTLNGLVNGGHYNELLALANLIYLPETESEEELISYLERAGIYADMYEGNLLTVDEVKAVQQAAMWYFTNYGDSTYDKTGDNITGWFYYTTDSENYTALSAYNPTSVAVSNSVGSKRMEQAEILYKYLINTAKANAGNYADTSKNYKTKLTLYSSTGNNGEQPLMEIEREKEFDLSLRKYITKVNGTEVNVSRVPQIDVSGLNNLTDTTAIYKHKKDPILVGIGDTVTYRIQVYNEGDVDGYVNKIVDQLPTGLTFSKLNTSGYTASYDSSSNKVTITRNEGNNDRLTAFNGTLDSTILELECTVAGTESNKVLTNVAWISEEETIDGNVITDTVGDDRDSEPSTVPSVNKDNMEDYRGNTSNKTDLTDSNYFYEGQQDDDDFEKLITKQITGSYNLQLEKVDKDNTETKLQGAVFSVTLPGQSATNKTTGSDGTVDLGTVNITDVSANDTITLTEVTPPTGYNKILDTMTLQVSKKLEGSSYVANTVSITSGQVEGTSARVEGNTIKIVVANEKQMTGSYNVQLEKVDKDNTSTKLSGAVFNVTLPGQSSASKTTGSNGLVDLGTVNITNVNTTDTITIEETKAPDGYNKILGTMQLSVTKKLDTNGGSYVADTVSITSGGVEGTSARVEGNTIKIVVPNEKITGNYSIQLVKVDNGNVNTKLEGAVFKVTLPDGSSRTETTDESGIINIGPINITQVGTDTITIEEVTPPSGYNKLFNSFVINVTKGISNGKYVATGASLGNTSSSGLGEGKITTNCLNSVVTITVPNEKIIGSYNLRLEKVDREDSNIKLEGAEFKVTLPDGSEQTITTDESGIISLGPINITETGTDTITIEEVNAPSGYYELSGPVVVEVQKQIDNGKYIISSASITSGQDFATINYKENSIELSVKNDKIKYFDLSLRKFIVAVSDDENIEDGEYLRNEDGSYTRAPVVDTSLLNTIGQDGQLITTAIYNHTKEPVSVKVNDYVIYMIRVYNEGNTNGYVTEIKDHLPPYLEYVNNEYNNQYGWSVSSDGRTVTTSYLENSLINKAEEVEGGYTLSYVEVPIMCRVTENAPLSENITNIADITDYTVDNEEQLEDRDSEEDNVNLPSDEELPGYKDDETGEYIPGQQDDDDFEKVIIKEFDLALRKFIVAVSNDETIEDEEYLRDEENCLLYEQGNIKDAIEKIERLVSDKKLREKLIENGLKTARERDWNKIEDQIMKLYE